MSDVFGNFEHGKEDDRESHSGNGGDLFGEEIDQAERNQRERDQGQAERNLDVADLEVQGHAEFALAGLFVAKHQDGQALHGEAPHHAEGVGLAQDEDVAAAEDDGEELQHHHHIQNAVGSSEAAMRVAEPVRKNAVFGDAVENAVRSDDGGVDRAGQHQDADHHDESAEGQPQRQRADEIHGQAADGIVRRSLARPRRG